MGAELSAPERAELAARIEAEPYAWVGQQPLRPSTAPVITPDGRLDPRPVVLRAFAVARGDRFEVLDGALASAAGAAAGGPTVGRRRPPAGTRVAKDVWVLAAPRRTADPVGRRS